MLAPFSGILNHHEKTYTDTPRLPPACALSFPCSQHFLALAQLSHLLELQVEATIAHLNVPQ